MVTLTASNCLRVEQASFGNIIIKELMENLNTEKIPTANKIKPVFLKVVLTHALLYTCVACVIEFTHSSNKCHWLFEGNSGIENYSSTWHLD